MSFSKKVLMIVAPAALLSLAGCATSFKADVARFQAMPAPQGQSFYVQPVHNEDNGSLEFAQYAAIVAQRLSAQGYSQAPNAAAALLGLGASSCFSPVVMRITRAALPITSAGRFSPFGPLGMDAPVHAFR